MQTQFTSKLPHVGTTIFTIMSALAAEHQAINLGQGFPDFAMSEELIALVNEAMQQGHNQYIHMNGYAPLREALAEKVQNLYGRQVSADREITITPGGTYALFTAFAAILHPGDEVICFEPAYDSYEPAIALNGAKVVPVPLVFPDYKIDWSAVKEKINEKTKAILINSPHNPTGSVLTAEDMQALQELVRDTPIFIISDEVYEHIIFDGLPHESVLKYPELWQRSFVCFSFGKVYHCTGWKLGYCLAPAAWMQEFRKVHQFNAFTSDTPKQVALSKFLSKKEKYLELGNFLEQKRNFFEERMAATRFKPLSTHGSYFHIYSYANLSDEAEKDFAIRLTKEAGVATIPVSAFYAEEVNHQVLRFCFCKKVETLEKAVDRLVKV